MAVFLAGGLSINVRKANRSTGQSVVLANTDRLPVSHEQEIRWK